MPKRIANIFFLTLLLLVFSGNTLDLPIWADVSEYPYSPLSDSNEDDDYFLEEKGPNLPAPTFYLTLVSESTLPDQGFVKSIFHPPTSIL